MARIRLEQVLEKSDSCLIVETHNTTKNNGDPNRDESLIISECQRIENPLEDLCHNSTTHDANTTKNNGSPKHDESIITSECRRILRVLLEICVLIPLHMQISIRLKTMAVRSVTNN